MTLARKDVLDPIQPAALGKPKTSYPTPNKVDRVVIERISIAPDKYEPLPYHSPHPDYDNNGLFLVWQGPVQAANNQVIVVRVYANDEASNEDWYNASIKYSGEVITYPVYSRSYIELRENYEPAAQASKLKCVIRLRVTNQGNYAPGTAVTATITGGGGSGATCNVIMNPAKTKVIALELVTKGADFTSNPTVNFSSGTAAATAVIQGVGVLLVEEETGKLDAEDKQMASLFIKVRRLYETLPGPKKVWDTYQDERGAVQRTTQFVLSSDTSGAGVGTEAATFTRNAGIVTKTQYEPRGESAIVLIKLVETWVEVVVHDKRVISEFGGGIISHDETTDEPGAQTVEGGYLVVSSRLDTKSPHEQTLITERLDPSSAIPTLELVHMGDGYASAPIIGFTGGTGGGATAHAVLGFPVESVDVTGSGSNYPTPPLVYFRPQAGTIGGGALAVCTLSFGVDHAVVRDPGSGDYNTVDGIPTINFSGGGGSGAAANALIGYPVYFCSITDPGTGPYTEVPRAIIEGDGDGALAYTIMGSPVESITITARGSNFATPPTVTVAFGSGSGLDADAILAYSIEEIQVNDGGHDFTEAPTIVIGPPETGGVQAVAVAVMGAAVGGVTMSASGSNYATPPTVSFANGDGEDAAGDAILGYAVFDATITNSGGGYTSFPSINIAGGSGSGATLNLRLGVDTATIIAAGLGYLVDDILTIVGGTFTTAGQLRVTSVGGSGEITGVSVETEGVYSAIGTNPRPTTGGGVGSGGFSLLFDGINDYVSFGSAIFNPNASTCTFQAWVRLNSSSDDNVLIGGYADATHYWMIVARTTGLCFAYNTGTGENVIPAQDPSPYIIPLDTWVHVSMSIGRPGVDDWLFVVNGVELDNGGWADSTSTFTTTDVRLGNCGSHYLDGYLDEVRTWTIARTESAIFGDYLTTLAGTETGLTHYYYFPEGTGSTTEDFDDSGTEDGTLNGAAWDENVPFGGGGATATDTFTFTGDDDDDGIFYFIGTDFGVSSWVNPDTIGRCTVLVSSNVFDVGNEDGSMLVNRAAEHSYASDNSVGEWVAADFGENQSVVVSDYWMKQRDDTANQAMRNWTLQGSNDVASNDATGINAATWTDIDIRVADTTMPASTGSTGHYTSMSEGTPAAYRWLRIITTGNNSSGSDANIQICEIEFYGDFTYAITASGAQFTIKYKVVEVNITAGGSLYESAPTITIGAPGGGGTTATATANLASTGVVKRVDMTNGGEGYTEEFAVIFTGGGGTGAAGTANLGLIDGSIKSVTVTEPGSGYIDPPPVSTTGGGGSDADLEAVLTSTGVVWRIDINDGGVYEMPPPIILISGGGGSGATGIAVLDLDTLYPSRVHVVLHGHGYSAATVRFEYEDGSVPEDLAASATLQTTGGELVGVQMTSAGTGYTSAPTLGFSYGSAAAEAFLATRGKVASVTMLAGGLYQLEPTVEFISNEGSGASGDANLATLGSVVDVVLDTPGSYSVAPTVTFTGSNTEPATAIYHTGAEEWPPTPGFHTDRITGIVTNFIKKVVPTGTPYPGREGYRGPFIDADPYDIWKTVWVTTRPDLNTLPAPEAWWSTYPFYLPPRLLSIEAKWSDVVGKSANATTLGDDGGSVDVSVSSGASGSLLITSRPAFRGRARALYARDYFFGQVPSSVWDTLRPIKITGSSGSVVMINTSSRTFGSRSNALTGGSRVNSQYLASSIEGGAIGDQFQKQVHAEHIDNYLVGGYSVINDTYRSQPVIAYGQSGSNVISITATGTLSEIQINLPASNPTPEYLSSGRLILVEAEPREWGYGIWVLERIYVEIP